MNISTRTTTETTAPRRAGAADLFWFLLVGGTAAACFIAGSTLLLALETGVPDWLLSGICYAVMVVPTYLAHRWLSFRSETPHGVALPRYVAVQLSALVLATFFSFVSYRVFGLPPLPASVLVVALTSGVSFVVLRLWAFARET